MATRKSSLLRQIAWAATLAAGFGTLWLVLVLWLGTSILEAWRGGNRPPYESLVVRSDGTLLIESIRRGNLSLDSTYRDLKGQVQETPDRHDQLWAVSMSGEHPRAGFFSSRLRMGWGSRLMSFVNERELAVKWFFVHDGKPDGAGYFVAYERTSNRRVGFLGMSGFRADPVPAADWIPVSGELNISLPFARWDVPSRWVYLPSGTQLRQVDLAARTITTVFEAREPIVAPGIPRVAPWSTGHPTKERPFLVRTTQQILELDQQHHVLKIFTIPTAADRRSSVQWYDLDNGQAIAVFAGTWPARGSGSAWRQTVYRLAGDRSIQDQFELDLQTGTSLLNGRALEYVLAVGLPAPAALFGVDLFSEMPFDETQSYPATLAALLRNSGPSLIAVLALSLILAVLAWRRSRAFGLSRKERTTCVLFVLLFGLPAYVGFLLYRRWPIRQPCPSCQARVPRDRGACAECGSGFPDPGLKGIEIFA